ncbi:hypothetical protein [Bradyrhizobium sp. HKCCYLS20291]|uniref:hypothetical protein n=1 Tax=Bradyrhizobium sp. HKCCYLS20291 TaxID=3420766 RepID=UPI003EBF4F08
MFWPIGIQIAGAAAIVVALIHGVAAEVRLFPNVTAASAAHVVLLRFVWQASTLAWITFGMLLVASPWIGRAPIRWIAAAAMVDFALGAAGGLIATGPTHYGWMLLTTLAALVGLATPWLS